MDLSSALDQVGDHNEEKYDTKIKEDRIRTFLDQKKLDGLVIGRQDNFAWLTAGGNNRESSSSDTVAGYILITRDRKWLVSHSINGQRIIDEQIADQEFELVTSYWHQASPVEKLKKLTRGMDVGADFPLENTQLVRQDLGHLHYPLTNLDLKRCVWVGRVAAKILSNIARQLEPGMSEIGVAARLLYLFAMVGISVEVLNVGFDKRILRYRQPVPTENTIERHAHIQCSVKRWGLHANMTRMVHFGEPPSNIRRAMDGVTTIGGHITTKTAPGIPFSDILAEQIRLYRELGYSGEWMHDYQGGITGYLSSDLRRKTDQDAVINERQAFDFSISITGAKFEELTLLTNNGIALISTDSDWPMRTVQTPNGDIDVPDVMIR